MNTVLKLAGLSAVLAAGLMAAMPASKAELPPVSGKTYHDRVPADAPASMAAPAASVRLADATGALAGAHLDRTLKGDSARVASAGPCAGQTWPYLSAECLAAEGAPVRKVSRTISADSPAGAGATIVAKGAGPAAGRR